MSCIAVSVFKLLTPQPAMASATQIAALSVTHQHFEDSQTALLKQKLNDVMLEMERKIMAAEDERAHAGKAHEALLSPYGTNVHTPHPQHRLLTWKEYALGRDELVHHLADDVIEPTRILVQQARQKALQVVIKADSPTQTDVSNLLVDAEKCLNESDFDSSDESEPSDED